MMNVKTSWSILFLIMVTMTGIGLVSCGDDEEEEKNEARALLVGDWVNSNATFWITFSDNGTGEVHRSDNLDRIPVGKFTYGNPYDVEIEKDGIWALVSVTYTSGDYSGKKKEWDYRAKAGSKNLEIEGISLHTR